MSGGGLSAVRLARLDDIMAGFIDRGEIPGLAWLVSRHGEVHAGAVGRLAFEGRPPVGRNSIFRISSMTKPVTAVAALMLVEECVLRLDDPVDDWLPELADRQVLRRLDGPLDDTVPAQRPITLRDALTFTLGFGVVMAPPGTHPIADACEELQLAQGPPNTQRTPAPDEWMRRLGTVGYGDRREEMVTILFTQRAWTSPNPPAVARDFLTAAYGAIDD
jgi:CubicO group peptidase (beta-lactamase class C family)